MPSTDSKGDTTSTPEERSGRVLIPQERLSALKDDPLFLALLQAGRIVNCLRFAHMAAYAVHEEDSPNRLRQMNNGFLVAIAYVSEALVTLGRLGLTLKALPSWQSQVVPILRDTRVEQLQGASVTELRNQVVFHFDDAPIAQGIRDIDLAETALIAMKGTERKDVYYQLADEVVLRRIMPDSGLAKEVYLNRVKEWIAVTTDISLQLSHALEAVIVDGAEQLGFQGIWEA